MKLKDKVFLIVMISFLVVAVLLIVIGYACIGLNIIEWLYSRWALWIYTAIGVFALFYVSLKIYDRIKKL